MIINPYRFATAGGITDPDDVTGCVGWYDASDSSTLLDATSGSPVADGAAVQVFEDKSALGTIRDFNQTSATSKPLRRAAQINGLDVLEFDGTNDIMALDSGFPNNALYEYSTQAEAKTVFVVSQPLTAATLADSSSLQLYKTANTGAGGLVTGEIAYRTNTRTFVSDGTAATTCSTSAPSIITLSQSGSGNIESVISMWLDGASVARDSGNNGALVTEDVITELGGYSTGGFYFDGYICEVIFYDNELSAGDRASVETYLADKWGVTI